MLAAPPAAAAAARPIRSFPAPARILALLLARGRPEVDVALDRVAIDRLELLGGEVQPLQGGDVLLELLDAARPQQRRGDALVAQRPGDRELRERLPARRGDLVQR